MTIISILVALNVCAILLAGGHQSKRVGAWQ
jgi:hypothetical protein